MLSMREHREVRGRMLLRRWLDADPSRSQSWLARRLHVSQPSVTAWLNGDSRPEAHNREALALLTGIPAPAWMTDDEHAIVEELRTELLHDASRVTQRGAA
jgi:transcriptional regulator with XRE-family HTH domain